MKPLLNDFFDLIPNELSNELPPMRVIQHALDLLLGASLPNLHAYQTSRLEHVELKKPIPRLDDMLDIKSYD